MNVVFLLGDDNKRQEIIEFASEYCSKNMVSFNVYNAEKMVTNAKSYIEEYLKNRYGITQGTKLMLSVEAVAESIRDWTKKVAENTLFEKNLIVINCDITDVVAHFMFDKPLDGVDRSVILNVNCVSKEKAEETMLSCIY